MSDVRHVLDLLDAWDRPIAVELLVRRDTVEFRCRDFPAGVADRTHLRHWLTEPHGNYCYDDVTWLHLGSGHRVALCIGDVVSAHVFDEPALTELCRHL